MAQPTGTAGENGNKSVALNVTLDIVHLLVYYIYVLIATPIRYIFNSFHLKSLENKIILVTGAASGIGQEICRQLASEDKSITLICWDVSPTGELVKELKGKGVSKVYGFTVDVSNRDQVVETADKIKKEIGDVSILFNNAGISGDGLPLWEQNPKVVERVIQINLLSNFWTLQSFLPGMIQSGREGHIVTTCSVLGVTQIKHLTPYNASKGGVRNMIETLKLDLQSDPRKPNIKFTTVYPNLTFSAMVNNFEKKYKYDFMEVGQSPAEVAGIIINGMRRNVEHVYPLGYNRLLPIFMASIPSAFFRKVHDIFHYEAVRKDKSS